MELSFAESWNVRLVFEKERFYSAELGTNIMNVGEEKCKGV